MGRAAGSGPQSLAQHAACHRPGDGQYLGNRSRVRGECCVVRSLAVGSADCGHLNHPLREPRHQRLRGAAVTATRRGNRGRRRDATLATAWNRRDERSVLLLSAPPATSQRAGLLGNFSCCVRELREGRWSPRAEVLRDATAHERSYPPRCPERRTAGVAGQYSEERAGRAEDCPSIRGAFSTATRSV